MEEVKVNDRIKEIPNFSRYLCDIYTARIYRKPTDKRKGAWLKKIKPNSVGYCYTTLKNDSDEFEGISLQWVVMCAATESTKEFFISKNLEVDHRDRNKENNHIHNLFLCNKNANMRNIGERKERSERLSESDIQYIFEQFKVWDGKKTDFYKKMADKFGCVWQTIQYLVLGINYKSVAIKGEVE